MITNNNDDDEEDDPWDNDEEMDPNQTVVSADLPYKQQQEKKNKKNVFNGRILEMEGLPDLKVEQAFELQVAHCGEHVLLEVGIVLLGERVDLGEVLVDVAPAELQVERVGAHLAGGADATPDRPFHRRGPARRRPIARQMKPGQGSAGWGTNGFDFWPN